jgi:hypothetical protein
MVNEDLTKIPIFFILGRPRSGTTLLSTLFNAHPNVRIAPEFPILLPLYQKFRKVKTWDEEAILLFVDHVYRNNVFNNRTLANLKIDREVFTASLLQMARKGTLQDFLKSINYHAFSVYPKRETLRIGDKNPIYSIYAKRFLRIFPEAKFICIIRDYRDNFVSMRKLSDLKLEAPILPLQVYRWRYVVKLFLKCKKRYPERFHLVRYEDLVTSQEETMQTLCSFIGIPYDPGVFDFFRKKEEVVSAYENPLIDKFHSSLMNPVNTSRMNQWQKDFSEPQVKLADQIAGTYADLLGYERVYKGYRPWVALKSLPMRIYGFLIFRLMVAGSYLPSRISLWLSLRLLILVRIYSRLSGKKSPADQSK